MASKLGLAGGIPERRVRPIWDAIDSRQFKNALKHVNSLLGKHPNSPYALSLKALILERMGKSEEALLVCSNAKELLYSDDSALMDDLTLSTLQMVFQRLDHLDLATRCYEYACGKFPNNLDLMMGLFNCYVREYSFVKQQQTAIKMYKTVAEERYLLWAVCSIHLQVLCGNGGEKLLVLAEGLLKKHVATHSLHEPEALVVYISLLEQQEKYSDALEILSGKLGSLLVVEVDRLRIKGRLLACLGDYDAAADTYQKILELCPDDWDCFQNYLGCLLKDNKCWSNLANDTMGSVDEKLLTLDDVEFDSQIARALELVHKLQEYDGNNLIRGPYVAYLEIERRKFLHGKGEADKLIEALVQYFARFGQLACFASDVEAYLQVLSSHRRMELIEKVRRCGELVSTAPINALGQAITIFKVQELIGGTYQLSTGDLQSSSVQMVEMYCKNLHYSKDLDPQESMHGEELLSLACNILVQLYWRTNNIGYALAAIMALEFGLTIRRFVWQYKILLLHLYSHLGAISLAYECYKSLEVKNILMETISHHILPQMLVSPLWLDLSNLLTDYLKFMDDHLRESADLTFLAYRNRSYSKVIEFVQFKDSLQHSNQYLIARIEAPILQLKQNAVDIDSEERLLENLKCGVPCVELSSEIDSKPLTFHEELQSRPWWTPCPGTNYLLGPFEEISYFPKNSLHQIKGREANTCNYIKRRSLLPRMIYLSIQNTSAFLKDSFESNGVVSDPRISAELKFLLERYSKILGCHLSEALDLIGKVSYGSESLKVFGSDMIDWMNIAVFCNAWKLNLNAMELQDAQACKYGGWHTVDYLLKKCIMEKIRSVDSQTCFPGGDLSALTQLITEPLAWHALIIQSCVRVLHPSVKKKKKSGQADLASLPLFSEVRDSIHSLCKIVEEVIKWVRNQIKRLGDEMLDAIFFALKDNSSNEGPGQIFQILDTLISSASSTEHGDRISTALKSWSPADVARKVVAERQLVFSKFLSICESRYKSLERLKQQIAQV